VARKWGLLNNCSEVGRRTLGTVVIFLNDISADISVNVEESSCGVDEVEGMADGGFVGEEVASRESFSLDCHDECVSVQCMSVTLEDVVVGIFDGLWAVGAVGAFTSFDVVEVKSPLMGFCTCKQGLTLRFPDLLLLLTRLLYKLSLSSLVVQPLTDDNDIEGERPG
jgi:hypothetical protein